MRFSFTHTFDVPIREFERVLFSEKLPQILEKRMKLILRIEPLEVKREGNILTRRVRYLPAPIIKQIGTRKVDPEWMEWIEESRYDFSTHCGQFRNIPTKRRIAAVMRNAGTLTLRSLPGDRTEQVLSGELIVSVFMVGKIAERIIHANAKNILDEEAAILRDILANKEI